MTTATQTLTTNNTGTPPAPAPVPQNPTWSDSVKDADTRTWLGTKNFPDAETAFKSHRNLESLMGADKAGRTVMMPKDDGDAEGWKQLNAKLGVPETADGYKLPVPEGEDPEFSKTASKWFHEAGVRPAAANKIAERWNAWAKEQVTAIDAEVDARVDREMKSLDAEWGDKAQENNQLALRGLNAFLKDAGIPDDDAAANTIKTLKRELGADKLIKFFKKIGDAMAESTFAGSDNKGGFSQSVKSAQDRIREITDQRMQGKINDHAWRTIFEPEMMRLRDVVTAPPR